MLDCLKFHKIFSFFRKKNNYAAAPLTTYEAVVETGRKVRDTLKANLAYTTIMSTYPKAPAERLVDGHEYLAEQAKDGFPAVAHLHLKLAQELAREENAALLKRIREQLDKVQPAAPAGQVADSRRKWQPGTGN